MSDQVIDQTMLDQLRSVFTRIENDVEIQLNDSNHSDQNELNEFLSQVVRTSSKLSLKKTGVHGTVPSFQISGSHTSKMAMKFIGIPSGHEFSSLILAILYADGKGKQPDQGVISRIQNIKGPIRIKTFISLTCENCPDVVQALHLISTHHPDMQHTMVDGLYAQDEIKTLGVQGVPSVVVDGKLLHSGRSDLMELIEKLEKHFGQAESKKLDINLGRYDIAVIGGGPAGVSAAIYSARKGLKTIIIAEKFGGQLRETQGIENMISKSYTEGMKLTAELAEHVGHYPIQILEHRRVQGIEDQDQTKKILLESGESLVADSIIIATGAKWRQLNIPGEKEYIGRGVAFCAHCDGPFYKGKNIVVVGGGNSGMEAALDLSNIAEHVTLFEFGDMFKADRVLVEKAKKTSNIKLKTMTASQAIVGDGSKVTAIQFLDRVSGKTEELAVDGVFVQIGLLPNSQFLNGVVKLNSHGEIIVDQKGHTSVKNIYAAGDVTTIPFKQIIMAMGDGAKAALSAFEDRLSRA